LTTQFPDSEKALLTRVAQGDEQAFASLFHTWRDKLYFFTLRITNSPEIARDLVQDVFVKVWVNRSSLVEVTNFSAWLYRVTQNHALSGMRRMALETTILAEIQRKAATSRQPTDEALLYKQLQEKLQAAIDRLPPQQKLVYTLSRIEGLKHEEIANRLHLSVNTVRNHMTEALRNIKDSVGRDYPSLAVYCLLLLALAGND
jgi:RNA polymerase sigma-70 factor (family 1)